MSVGTCRIGCRVCTLALGVQLTTGHLICVHSVPWIYVTLSRCDGVEGPRASVLSVQSASHNHALSLSHTHTPCACARACCHRAVLPLPVPIDVHYGPDLPSGRPLDVASRGVAVQGWIHRLRGKWHSTYARGLQWYVLKITHTQHSRTRESSLLAQHSLHASCSALAGAGSSLRTTPHNRYP